MPKSYIPVTLRVDEEFLKQLDDAAKKRHISRHALIVLFLKEGLERTTP